MRKRHLQGKFPFARLRARECASGKPLAAAAQGLTFSREAHPSRTAVRGVYRKFGLDEEQAADDVWLGAALDNVQGADFCRRIAVLYVDNVEKRTAVSLRY